MGNYTHEGIRRNWPELFEDWGVYPFTALTGLRYYAKLEPGIAVFNVKGFIKYSTLND
jgi:hypothetical protein